MKGLVVAVLLVGLSTAISLPNLFGKVQSAGVKGKLTCNGEPAEQVKVKLYDVDRGEIDDLMAEGFTDGQGRFQLSGKETELTSIDPKLNIYHKCNHQGLCFKKISMVIPDSYISQGPEPERIFDIGEINLAAKFSGESTDCIN